ncbi:MAG: OmpH family outer membrane protein [Lacinutrix sp.]|uniref:OmpH family outer membrane protein n=1 Tax=Lacinutrix sp. TaxID=1937692 RepID=UPI0030A574C5
MKQIKTLLIAATLFFAATSLTNAQSKVAHINTGELIQLMPEMIAANGDLQKIAETVQADIQAMQLEIKKKSEQYNAESQSKTDEENEKRFYEVEGNKKDMRDYAVNADNELKDKRMKLYEPIFKQAKAAILKVGKAQGFDYVLDSTEGGGLLMADGKNLLEDVKKELGIK